MLSRQNTSNIFLNLRWPEYKPESNNNLKIICYNDISFSFILHCHKTQGYVNKEYSVPNNFKCYPDEK